MRTDKRQKEVSKLQEVKYITIISNKKKIVLNVSTTLYILMNGNNAEIHVSGGKIYETNRTEKKIKCYDTVND